MADIHSIIGTKNKKGQTYTDTWKMMNEAPRTPSFYTGSEVIKEAIRRASCDVMIAYPITPQSEAAALIGELFAEGYIGDYFRGESEFAVMSQCAGSFIRWSPRVYDYSRPWHHASYGKLSDVGWLEIANSDDRHLPRYQLAVVNSAGYAGDLLPTKHRDVSVACGNSSGLL